MKIRFIAMIICFTAILTPAAFAEKHALVIGNGSYKTFPLGTPVNDADAIASTLGKLGFSVVKKTDASHYEMEKAIREFGSRLGTDDTALFYFSGHGSQVDGINYLIPVKAGIESPDEIRFKSVPADIVLAKMETSGSRVNIVILDACRNAPSKAKSIINQGLAPMTAPQGTFIAYATAPGTVAWTGKGSESIYTKHLVNAMKVPGLKIEDMFKKVRMSVVDETSHKKKPQVPWESSCLMGDFYFADSSGAVIRTPEKETSLTVRPNVSDAAVWINGKKMGTGSLRFAPLSPGDYRIKVTRDGYLPYETSVEIGKGESLDVPAYLAKPEPPKPKPIRQRTSADNGVRTVNSMEFVRVPGGKFRMGCGSWAGSCYSGEKPVHEVYVDDFYMGKYEVTQGQWKKIMGSNPSRSNKGDSYPVENVSWNDVQEFIRKLNEQSDGKYRLPTEAEWEYACRSGGKSEKYCGGSNIDKLAWYGGNSGSETHSVGRKAPNGLGIYDMSGNVWEWCRDWYGNYPSGSVRNPKGPNSGSPRVLRGGSWGDSAAGCRSAHRYGISPGYRYSFYGLRLVLSPGQQN
ncbi:SUMF1/EgtB/PvdO family nonheme iron enzyme [Desulfococcaceae bacterium HSG8]|nr:SUMF1/EgtB/PvdO family nonheme iron enzyme [Desulfococcaceae bacterium HSG8]